MNIFSFKHIQIGIRFARERSSSGHTIPLFYLRFIENFVWNEVIKYKLGKSLFETA